MKTEKKSGKMWAARRKETSKQRVYIYTTREEKKNEEKKVYKEKKSEKNNFFFYFLLFCCGCCCTISVCCCASPQPLGCFLFFFPSYEQVAASYVHSRVADGTNGKWWRSKKKKKTKKLPSSCAAHVPEIRWRKRFLRFLELFFFLFLSSYLDSCANMHV